MAIYAPSQPTEVVGAPAPRGKITDDVAGQVKGQNYPQFIIDSLVISHENEVDEKACTVPMILLSILLSHLVVICQLTVIERHVSKKFKQRIFNLSDVGMY